MNIKEHVFWSYVEPAEGCWTWLGKIAKGYGRYGRTGAHRVAYLLRVGPIPEGLEIDHLCRNTACVRPDHLEAVTHEENMRRRAASTTECKYGHPFSPENTYTLGRTRHCRACGRRRSAAYTARRAS